MIRKRHPSHQAILDAYREKVQSVSRGVAKAYNDLEAENLHDSHKAQIQSRIKAAAAAQMQEILSGYHADLEATEEKLRSKIHRTVGANDRLFSTIESVREVKDLTAEYKRAVRIGDMTRARAIASEAAERGDLATIRLHGATDPAYLAAAESANSYRSSISEKAYKVADKMDLGTVADPKIVGTKHTKSGPVYEWATPSDADKMGNDERVRNVPKEFAPLRV